MIEYVTIFEWVLLAAFILSAFKIPLIGSLMVVNIGLSILLYKWFTTIPPEAASIVVCLINFFTIGAILVIGEKSIQRVIQPVILLGFIILDILLLSGAIYDSFEAWLLILYGLMFLTIFRDGWDGTRILLLAEHNNHTGRNSGADINHSRDNTDS